MAEKRRSTSPCVGGDTLQKNLPVSHVQVFSAMYHHQGRAGTPVHRLACKPTQNSKTEIFDLYQQIPATISQASRVPQPSIQARTVRLPPTLNSSETTEAGFPHTTQVKEIRIAPNTTDHHASVSLVVQIRCNLRLSARCTPAMVVSRVLPLLSLSIRASTSAAHKRI